MEEDEIAEHERQSSALSLETMELQWNSYVSNLKASGTLASALAVCDVSGSMSGEPMQVIDDDVTKTLHTQHLEQHAFITLKQS